MKDVKYEVEYSARIVPNNESYYVKIPQWLIRLWNLKRGNNLTIKIKKP
jgi:hypothetical protein